MTLSKYMGRSAIALMALASAVVANAEAPPESGRTADCTSTPLQPGEMALFRDSDGGEYTMFSVVHGDQRFSMFSDFKDNWRGPLELQPDGRAQIRESSSPPLTVICRNGGAERIKIFRDEGVVTAERVPLAVREVTFSNGDVQLSGTVVAPDGAAMLPGVVFVHGSGPSLRADFAEFSLRAAGRGIVALAYDKRGAGQSTGDWEAASFADLAEDAIAAFQALGRQPEVDTRRIGIFGASQGTWVGAIAAANSNPAFFISSGGGPVSPAAQERYRRLLLASGQGLTVSELELARRTLDAWFQYLRSPSEHSDEISALWKEVDVANRPWRRSLGLPTQDPTAGEWPVVRHRFARELHFDPLPYYARITAPMLGILGLEDEAFPVADTILAYNALPPEQHVAIVGIPGASHGWFVESAGGKRYQAPEAYDAMFNWILSVKR